MVHERNFKVFQIKEFINLSCAQTRVSNLQMFKELRLQYLPRKTAYTDRT